MRIFILLAILFFSWRVFAQSFDYYYIEEYMRAKEDPEYSQHIQEKLHDETVDQQAVNSFKLQREYEAYLQEENRKEYIAERNRIVIDDKKQVELDRQDELRREKEAEKEVALEQEYNIQQLKEEIALRDRQPNRLFASVIEAQEHHRVPKATRKFRLKGTKVIHKQ